MIRPVRAEDAREICAIYNHYIKNTVITFEEELLEAPEMERRIAAISAKYPWLVHEENGEIIGYAYANSYRDRSAYRYAAELSIYLKEERQGEGIGSALFGRLLSELKETKLHALVSAITLPNERSIALQEKFGFKEIARFAEIGFKFGKWLEVGYWELIISP
jgi:phosphinothricin acetyltransferase